jgi:hypothetical protein
VCAFPRVFTARFSAVFASFPSFFAAFASFPARFSAFFGAFPCLPGGSKRGHELVLVQVGIPDVHRPHLREGGHRLPVSPHRRQRRRPRIRLGEPVVAARDLKARRHPLHVPLERPRQRLIEVVHIEQQDPLGRRERAEVRQMRIAAQLGLQPGHRRIRQVRRHDLGRAPVEGERRNHHPAMPDRHQILLTGAVLLLQQRNRIGAARSRAPLRMAR